MIKTPLFLLFTCFVLLKTNAQSYTIYKSGTNTWGGAYVPPVWGKTYDFNTPAYQPPTIKSGSSGSPSSSTPGTSGGNTSGYVKKNKWASIGNASDQRDRWSEKNATLRQALINYFNALIKVIDLFDEGLYASSLEQNNKLFYTATRTKADFDQYGHLGIYEEYMDSTRAYQSLEYYYKYLCLVKLHRYTEAVEYYNMTLSRFKPTTYPYDYKPLRPLTAQYYFVFDNTPIPENFEPLSAENHFRGDLFIVETLVGLGKMNEAKKLMEATLNYYTPLFGDLADFNAQIAINYFYLRQPDLARKHLEYYCHQKQSNNARLAIVNELLFSEPMATRWDQANCPGCFTLIEDNMLFLDELNQKQKKIAHLYSFHNWNELYLHRSNNILKFIAKAEPTDEEFRQLGTGELVRIEGLDYYLMALLKQGDDTRIHQVMKKLAQAAETQKQSANIKGEMEMVALYKKSTADAKQWHKDHVEGYDKERAKTSRSYKTSYDIRLRDCKENITGSVNKYWEYKYRAQALPFARALQVFTLMNFAKAGGVKYLQQYAAPYVNELSKYTQDEASYAYSTHLITCGILPNFKKSRAYPNDVD